jgi:hypothetical protein
MAMRLWILVATIASLLPASAAIADGCPKSSDEIATDRPDITNSSIVVPVGSLQNENGINLSARSGERVLDGTNSRLRLGVAPCVELLVDLPTYFSTIRGQADQPNARHARPLRDRGGWIADGHDQHNGPWSAALSAVSLVAGAGLRLELEGDGHAFLSPLGSDQPTHHGAHIRDREKGG